MCNVIEKPMTSLQENHKSNPEVKLVFELIHALKFDELRDYFARLINISETYTVIVIMIFIALNHLSRFLKIWQTMFIHPITMLQLL